MAEESEFFMRMIPCGSVDGFVWAEGQEIQATSESIVDARRGQSTISGRMCHDLQKSLSDSTPGTACTYPAMR